MNVFDHLRAFLFEDFLQTLRNFNGTLMKKASNVGRLEDLSGNEPHSKTMFRMAIIEKCSFVRNRLRTNVRIFYKNPTGRPRF